MHAPLFQLANSYQHLQTFYIYKTTLLTFKKFLFENTFTTRAGLTYLGRVCTVLVGPPTLSQ